MAYGNKVIGGEGAGDWGKENEKRLTTPAVECFEDIAIAFEENH